MTGIDRLIHLRTKTRELANQIEQQGEYDPPPSPEAKNYFHIVSDHVLDILSKWATYDGSSTSAQLHVSIAEGFRRCGVKTGLAESIRGGQNVWDGGQGEKVVDHVQESVPAVAAAVSGGYESNWDTLSDTDSVLDVQVLYMTKKELFKMCFDEGKEPLTASVPASLTL